jgi:hypothetical protein
MLTVLEKSYNMIKYSKASKQASKQAMKEKIINI